MDAINATLGQKYLSPTNVPVIMEGVKGDKVQLEVITSGNVVEVPKDYKLKVYDPALLDEITKLSLGEREVNRGTPRQNKETTTMDASTDTSATAATTKRTRGGISAIIDPLLFEGGRTVAEIVELVKQSNPDLAAGRNLVVNVRVRMHTLQKRGFKLEEDAEKRVKLSK